MRSLKCVVLGDGAVGKTSLLISYTTNTFPTEYVPTVFDNYSVTISVDPASSFTDSKNETSQDIPPFINERKSSSDKLHLYKLNLWDTAGQEEYDRLRPLSYPQTDIFLLCFSVNELTSFKNLNDKWLPELKQHANIGNNPMFKQYNKFPILLIGTKSDLREEIDEEICVPLEQINRFVEENNLLGYVECSAKYQTGVAEIFQTAVQKLVYEYDPTYRKQMEAKIDSITTSQPENKTTPNNSTPKSEKETPQSSSNLSTKQDKSKKPSIRKTNSKHINDTTSSNNQTLKNKNINNTTTTTYSKSNSTKKKGKKSLCIIM